MAGIRFAALLFLALAVSVLALAFHQDRTSATHWWNLGAENVLQCITPGSVPYDPDTWISDQSCTGDPELADKSSDMTTSSIIPHPSSQFAASLLVSFYDPDFQFELGSTLPLGAVMGRMTSDTFIGKTNNPCNTNLSLVFAMLNGTTDKTKTFVVDPDHGNILADTCEADNDLPNHVDCYPDYNNRVFDPDGAGGLDPIQPLVRLTGYSSVAGTDILVQFMVFDKGALSGASGFQPPHPYSQFDASWGYPSVIMLLNPADPAAPSAINFFCSPLISVSTLYGVTQDLTDAIAPIQMDPVPDGVDEGGHVARKTPTTTGTHYYHYFGLSYRNADGDPYPTNYDSCKFCHNFDDQFNVDSDGDMIDPCCDPDGATNAGDDYDSDGYTNGNDYCPLISNPFPQNEGELTAPWPQDAGPRQDEAADDCEGAGFVILPEADGCLNAVDDDPVDDGTPFATVYINDGCPKVATDDDTADNAERIAGRSVNDGCSAVGDSEKDTAGWCDDSLDNDGDTTVNDGCDQVGDVSESSIAGACTDPETDCGPDEAAPLDDDGDTRVNDGCAAINGSEEGANPDEEGCHDAVDNDGDTNVNDGCPKAATDDDIADAAEDTAGRRVNDGCPAVGDSEKDTAGWCDDNLDNDGDTTVNDGCDQVGTVDENAIAGACTDPEDDACVDALDDEEDVVADGLVNDGCPAKGDPENPATECADDVDDDGDTRVNDGCPAVGVSEEDADECAEDPAVDDDGDTRVNDGCPVKGVAAEGRACNNNVDDDQDGWFDEGCDSDDDIANGTYNAALVLMAMCIGETDDDGDGWCDDDEIALGSPWDSTGEFHYCDETPTVSTEGAPGGDHDGDCFANPPYHDSGGGAGSAYPYSPCVGGSTTDCVDNCPIDYNPSQADADGDGIGDACDLYPHIASDGDYDNDGATDTSDPCPQQLTTAPLTAPTTDSDSDGIGNRCDPMINVDYSPFGRPENISLHYAAPLNDAGAKPIPDEKLGMDGVQQVCDDGIDNDGDTSTDKYDSDCSGAQANDFDSDYATDAMEWWVGADPFDDCSDDCNAAAFTATHHGWAFDVNDDCWANSSDILAFSQTFVMPIKKGTLSDKPYKQRFDVAPDNWINSSDIIAYSQSLVMPMQCFNP